MEDKMSKVSVIVPYLKGPSYLEECIQSIEDQNLPDFEIILVDDKDGHEVPEQVLAMKHVKHIVMDDEIDADEYFDRKHQFFENEKRKSLGMTEEEFEAYKVERERSQAASEDDNDMDDSGSAAVSGDTPFEGELEIPLRPFGVAAARNMGLKYAEGDYIYFLDADDYLWEDALTKLVKLAEEKKAKVVTGNRWSSWFRPVSFDFEKAKPDSEIEGICPLEGEGLEQILKKRFI